MLGTKFLMELRKKQKQIIETAIDCIFKYGIQKTNANLVAQELGIPSSLVFYYFPRQQDLFDSLIGVILDSNAAFVRNLMEKGKAVRNIDRLLAYLEGTLEWARQCPAQAGVLAYGVLEASHNPDMRQKAVFALQGGEDKIYFMLAAGLAEKEFLLEMETRETARLIHQALIGTIIYLYAHLNDTAFKESMKRLKNLVNLLLPSKKKKKK